MPLVSGMTDDLELKNETLSLKLITNHYYKQKQKTVQCGFILFKLVSWSRGETPLL